MIQDVKIGHDSLSYLKSFLSDNLPKNIFLVTGKDSFFGSGAHDKLEPILRPYNYFRFHDFEENPKVEDVIRGIELFNLNKCDIIIAVGGGSVIDMAKLVNIFHSEKGDISSHILSSETRDDMLPFVALPTTSGAGSEATHFAVVYVRKKKYSVANSLLIPDLVLIDSSFTFSASPYLTAVTGLDAFSQAIESYWSINATDESQMYSRKAIKIIWNNLHPAVINNCKEAKNRLSKASYLAGKAINIAKTTAPHAFSYPFTSFFGIPHGHAVSLTLPYFIKYNFYVKNSDCNDPRGIIYVKKTMLEILSFVEAANIDEGLIKIEKFIEGIGIKRNLSQLGIDDKKIQANVIDKVNPERLNNNPRKVNPEDIKGYLIEQ